VPTDLRDRSVCVDDRPVEFSAVEYQLLCQLAGEPTRVLTKVKFETRSDWVRNGGSDLSRFGTEPGTPTPVACD
jgi:DNA-binding response OmpR family regulator